MAGTFFASHSSEAQRQSNLAPEVWVAVKKTFGLKGDLFGKDARSLAREVTRVCLALCHAPQYQSEHKESLAHDWAHVPIPKSRELFDALNDSGEMLAVLLNPVANPSAALKLILGEEGKYLAVPSKNGGGNVGEGDLTVEYSFFGGAQGGWRYRSLAKDEPMHEDWGDTSGDLYINDAVFFRHVPELVWRYELGG
jgi:type ISP restriction-modification system protein